MRETTRKAKERRDSMVSALLRFGDEDSCSFRALIAHRPEKPYPLLERRGLIYRSMTCIPERCGRGVHHGPVPSGDCTREGWLLSLRGRLVIELLRKGMNFDLATWWAHVYEKNYSATTVVHERVGDRDQTVIIGTDLPQAPPVCCRSRLAAIEGSAAERAVAGELERMRPGAADRGRRDAIT